MAFERQYGREIHWKWIRFLQKARVYYPFLRTSAGFRMYIPDPPGVVGYFSSPKLEKKLLGDDPSLSAILHLTKSATTFWDIGASIGIFSLAALLNNPSLGVLSIEPSSDHFHTLS